MTDESPQPPPSSSGDALVGHTLVDRYRLTRKIGEGGMGAVYEAEQDSPRRPVALKVVRPDLASPALLKRFTYEAQVLARLHHPGIAQVYEAGLADDGQPCGSRGRTWASSFAVAHGSPPWQSVQPRRTVAFACGSPELAWQVTQPALLRSTSAAVCSMRLTPTSSGGNGKGSLGSTG